MADEGGVVFRGKSMLMDLWFRSLPTPHKFRVHYHQFLLYIYGKVRSFLSVVPPSARACR